ncbi:MAG: hypothetical protein OEM16_03845 [Myxococcales bacterium]|nr:hypothetical protein [Myxococcales bacterium]
MLLVNRNGVYRAESSSNVPSLWSQVADGCWASTPQRTCNQMM